MARIVCSLLQLCGNCSVNVVMDDHELLHKYVQSRSEDAFRELLNRHLPMVYSAAQRMVCDSHLAEEIAQNVFTTLSRKGASVRPPQVVGGWLYNTTRNLALQAVRSEQRRRVREQTAADMQSIEAESEPNLVLDELEPIMAELPEKDRDVLVLRFLENRSFKEVATELGIKEDAARMRVNRALEELRGLFGRKGIAVTSAALGGILSANTATAIPVGLAASILTAASIGTVAVAPLFITTWFNAKAITLMVGTALLAGGGTYWMQQREVTRLAAHNRDLAAQRDKLREEHESSKKDIERQQRELKVAQQNQRELLQLRNEVGKLRKQRDAQEFAKQNVQTTVRAQEISAVLPPGTFITTDKLVFAGFETPEAAFQSMTFGMVTGSYDTVLKGMSPEEAANQDTEKARKSFESSWPKMTPSVKGFQLLAKKVVSDDIVELKTRFEMFSQTPEVAVMRFKKINGEWKMTGSGARYRPEWEQKGPVETFAE